MNSFTPRSAPSASTQLEGAPASMGASSFGSSMPRHGAGAGSPPEPPRFRPQIVRSLRQHRALAIGVAIFVCLWLVGMGLRQGKVYVAQSLVYVEPTTPGNVISAGAAGFDQTRYASYLDQQMQTVTRPDILAAALETLPAGTWAFPGETTQGAAARLQKALTVERLLTGYDLSIKLSTPVAEHSAAVVNAVTNAYLAGGRKDELTQAGGREQILNEERQRIAEELEADRKEQAALGLNLGVANPVGESGNPFDVQLVNLRAQLAEAREAHDIAAAQLSSVSGSAFDQQSGLAAVADEAINTDQGLASLKAAMNARRAVLEGEMAGMTPSNPRFKQDQDEIADLERSLSSATDKARGVAARRIQDKLHVELQRTGAVEGQLNAQLAQETAKATGAGPKLERASELAMDMGRLHSRYAEVDVALRALQLETNGPGMAHLALAASVPASPESNHQKLYFLMALPFGVLCGIAAAVLARARDRRIFVGADLEAVVGFPPMAVLPAREEVAPAVLSEYVLRLAAAVEGAYRTRSARTFIITAVSAKTDIRTLLLALAQRIEDLRLKVLVLPGGDLLVTSQETAEHQFRISDSTAGEGIAAAKLERFKRENDIILVDGAPVLHSAETEYAARCADATLLIAESGVTLSTELSEATGLLARLQVQGVGIVLQELKLKDADASFKTAISVIEQRGQRREIKRREEVRPEPRIARPEELPMDPVLGARDPETSTLFTSPDATLAEREHAARTLVEIQAEAHAAPVVNEEAGTPAEPMAKPAAAPTESEVLPDFTPKASLAADLANPSSKSALQPEADRARRVQTVQVVTEIPSFTPMDVEAVDTDVASVPLIEELVPEMSSLRISSLPPKVPDKPGPLPYSSEASTARRRANGTLPRRAGNLQPIPLLRPAVQTARASRFETASAPAARSGENARRQSEAPKPEVPQTDETEVHTVRGLSRRWALLSHYDPNATDPTPAGRGVKPRFVETDSQKSDGA